MKIRENSAVIDTAQFMMRYVAMTDEISSIV